MRRNAVKPGESLKLFLTTEEVLYATTMGLATVWNMIHHGEFPHPRLLSRGRTGWLVSDVVAWAEARPNSDLLPPSRAGTGGTPEAKARRALEALRQQTEAPGQATP